jgi:hypothetical protein
VRSIRLGLFLLVDPSERAIGWAEAGDDATAPAERWTVRAAVSHVKRSLTPGARDGSRTEMASKSGGPTVNRAQI